jgi:class 3 adenylate cyclase
LCISSHIGVVGFYLRSARAAAAVEQVISDAEKLRDSNKAFATLGIGLTHGPLIADFHKDGSVNATFTPVGEVANHASRAVHGMQNYRETLADLYES